MDLAKALQTAAGNAGGDFYPYTVDNSARFASSSDKLTRTNSGSGSTKGCFSMWVKRSKLNPGAQVQLIATGSGEFYFSDSTMAGGTYYPDAIGYYEYFSSSYQGEGSSSINSSSAYNVFRDVSAWYHIFIVWDTTLSTGADRYQIWVNNQRVTLNSSSTVAQNTLARWFYTGDIVLGNNSSNTKPIYSYLAEVVGVEGTAYAPTDFAEDKNGVWVPKNVSGLTFGTNGFYLDFADSSNLGNDVSGNNNDFTVSGLTSSDQVSDTPTNNFATWNPIPGRAFNAVGSSISHIVNYSNGNLDTSCPAQAGSASSMCRWSSISAPDDSQQYYAEFTNFSNITPGVGGFQTYDNPGGGGGGEVCSWAVVFNSNGNVYFYYGASGSTSGTATSFTSSDTIGVLIDRTNATVKFYKNGSLIWTVSSITGTENDGWYFIGLAGSSSSSSTINADFGQLGFTYTPPTDSVTLSTASLTEPTIGPNSATTSGENFNTVLWTGTGATNNITGVGFQPDFTWIKQRSAVQNHVLHDAVRGAGKYIMSDNTSAEATNTNQLSSFDSDGFTVGTASSTNQSGGTFVGWNWKANGSGSSNTDGTITSTVSANQDAGISIVSYTGNGTSGSTVGHGLSQIPNVIIVKSRILNNWCVWHTSLSGNTYILNLDVADGERVPTTTMFTPANNTSSVFGLGNNSATNKASTAFISYAFAEVEGFSSFGKYTGNGSTDGPFIYTGFRPAFIITKRTDTSGYWWEMVDTAREPYNPSDQTLYANVSDSEYTSSVYDKDLLSNGFKIRGTNGGHNASGGSYIYMAFAENPFKYSNAR